MHKPAKLPAMIDSAAAIAASPPTALADTNPMRRPIRRMMLEAGYVHSPRPTTLSATGRVARAGSDASTSPANPPTSTISGTADRLSMVAMTRIARLARDVLRSSRGTALESFGPLTADVVAKGSALLKMLSIKCIDAAGRRGLLLMPFRHGFLDLFPIGRGRLTAFSNGGWSTRCVPFA